MSRCRTCGAAITWVRTANDKLMPLDVAPDDELGNVALSRADLTGEPIADVFPNNADARAHEPIGSLYLSHFATCDQAAEWRQR